MAYKCVKQQQQQKAQSNQPSGKCQLKWIQNMWYLEIMEYYPAIKKEIFVCISITTYVVL